jgi:hypothetical protein
VKRSPIFDARGTRGSVWAEIARHARIGGRLGTSLGPAAFLGALILISAVAALAGGLLGRQLLVARPPLTTVVSTGHLAEAGGLLLRIESTTWESDGSKSEPGHAMLINGRPARCLHVRIALQNPTDRIQVISTHEFQLRARTGTAWSPTEDSFPPTTLGSKEALSSILVFDVPDTEMSFQLVWTRDHQERRIPVGSDGPAGSR